MIKRCLSLALSVLMVTCIFASGGSVFASSTREAETNDTYETAMDISIGSSVTGKIATEEDVDIYKLVPKNDGKLDLTFKHSTEGNTFGWAITVYLCIDGEYHTIYSKGVRPSDSVEYALPFVGVKADKCYYIKVEISKFAIAGYDYTLSTAFTKSDCIEQELNEDYTEASRLDYGKTYSGNISTVFDKDFYRVYVPKNAEAVISFKHKYTEEQYIRWKVTLYTCYKGDMSETYTEEIGGTDKNSIELFGLVNKKNTKYYLRVSEADNSNYVASGNYQIESRIGVFEPYSIKTDKRTTKGFQLKWEKKKGVDGVQVQLRKSGKWKDIKSGNIKKCMLTGLSAGKEYSVRLRSYQTIDGSVYYSEWVRIEAATSPAKAEIKKLSPNKKRKISIKWKKVSSCSGYQIQYCQNSKFKKTKSADVSKKKTDYTITGLKTGKTYFVRVRAYKVIDGKTYYGEWSASKSVKCK